MSDPGNRFELMGIAHKKDSPMAEKDSLAVTEMRVARFKLWAEAGREQLIEFLRSINTADSVFGIFAVLLCTVLFPLALWVASLALCDVAGKVVLMTGHGHGEYEIMKSKGDHVYMVYRKSDEGKWLRDTPMLSPQEAEDHYYKLKAEYPRVEYKLSYTSDYYHDCYRVGRTDIRNDDHHITPCYEDYNDAARALNAIQAGDPLPTDLSRDTLTLNIPEKPTPDWVRATAPLTSESP